MTLVCQRCGHRGGADLSFIWFVKKLEVRTKEGGMARERTLWLCPDCASELGSNRQCTAFLRKQLKE